MILKRMTSVKERTQGIVFVFLAAGMLVGATGCGINVDGQEGKSKNGNESKKEEAVPVEVVTIERGPIEGIIQSSTDLEAESEVKVFSRTTNFARELFVEEGDAVEQGDPLLRLENDAQSIQFAKAQNQYENAHREFERQKKLHEEQLISDKEFYDVQFQLKQSELNLEEARRELEFTEIFAPISGVITRRLVRLGDHVTTNQHLFDIIDFNSIVARIYIPEKYLTQLELNQDARVYAPSLGGDPNEGHVLRIAPTVDAASGTVKVTIGFENPGDLRPGMYVNVELVTYVNPEAVLIPKEALVYDADQIFVLRLVPGLSYPNRRVERVLIEPRLMDRNHVEPRGGVKPGDRLVVTGKIGLKEDALVRLPEDPKPDENGTSPASSNSKTDTGAQAGAEDKPSDTPARAE